ncbi:PAS domain S-box protein [Desulfosarcina ovata]|uniref:histidine kinase n=1 Tax=Desulfosarcina ovata subsp. ovata TaxID=2752305 RepID=A0A5K8AFS3_9BACT|nr:PAS domain S-box protein [Desulfosarcina ovata]BBO91451.1 hypothetical protein DSCOOX_46310 [Desulfosarcina ovata subsp. ovata]
MVDHSGTGRDKYLTLFESLQFPVALLDKDCRIDAMNSAWKNLFRDASHAGAGNDTESRPHTLATWISDDVRGFVSSGRDEDVIEKRVETVAGKRHLSVKLKRMPDVGDTFSGCVIVLDDITRQKKTELALQETTIWLTKMFNALEEAVFIGTSQGMIVNANRAARRIFGYALEDLKNQTTELLHVDHEHFMAFNTRLKEELTKGESTTIEYVARRKNGEVFPVIANVTRLKREDNKTLGIVSILRDISAIKMAEEAARDSERLQGALELAGAVCHDMNQPLMAITGYAELLLMECC